MSRNSKTAKRLVADRQISAQRKNGSNGPAKTTPKHNKKKAWWQMFPSYGAYIRGGQRQKTAE